VKSPCFNSARNLQKISMNDYHQLTRLMGRRSTAPEAVGEREGQRRYDTGRICAKCRSFWETLPLTGKCNVYAETQVHPTRWMERRGRQGEGGGVRGCAREPWSKPLSALFPYVYAINLRREE